MTPRYNSQGVLDFWFVCPSQAIANLALKKLVEQYPELNYCCRWKDVRGWGLHVTVAEWKTQAGGPMYFVPN